MQVPRLGAELKLQLLTYATATWNLSHICDLHHSYGNTTSFNPVSRARDQTQILMDTSRVCYHWVTEGTAQEKAKSQKKNKTKKNFFKLHTYLSTLLYINYTLFFLKHLCPYIPTPGNTS